MSQVSNLRKRFLLVATLNRCVGLEAAAQTCTPYYVDLGHLPLQWYAMSWAVLDRGLGRDVYKASFYGEFLERLHGGQWETVPRNGLPLGYSVVGVQTVATPTGDQLWASVLQRFPESELYFRLNGDIWGDGIPIAAVDGYDSVGGYPVMVDMNGTTTLFATAAPHDPPPPVDYEVAQFEDGHWTTIGGCHQFVDGLFALPDGDHQALWAIGTFTEMNGIPASGIAKWDGQTWTGFGGPTFSCGYAGGIVADIGLGPHIYAAGQFDGQPQPSLCMFNGTQWVFLGAPDPLPPPFTPSYMTCLGVFDDGRGPALYIGGIFRGFAGVTARNLVRYDGQTFEAIGAGIVGEPSWIGAYQDIRGSAMFVGGDVLTGAGGGTLQQSAAVVIGCASPQCYANCDLSTSLPRLNVNDFQCFLNAFARRDPYANCTVDANFNVADFMCFMNKFAAGCS